MIAQKSVERILDTARIDEVVSDFVTLRKRGANLLGLCPFHTEKTPSFTVSPAKNLFKCFGCGRGGDPVKFLREHEGFSYPEALKYLAAKYQIEIEETQEQRRDDPEEILKDQLFVVNQYARDYFSRQLFESEDGKALGLSYFKERGFRESILEKFDLGFAPTGGSTLTVHAVHEGFRSEILQQAGLSTSHNRDFFRERVMFTIHGLSGKPVAFAGRILGKTAKGPKYINSPETPIYHKSNVLYGLYFARQAIRKEDNCYMVEGYTDVLSLVQGGIENVVASSGTALTPEQIRLIKRFTPNMTILFDGDAAGLNAAMRGLDLVLEQDMNVKVVVLPDGQDPDSYLSELGPEKFLHFLETERKDFILFKTSQLLQQSKNDPVARTQVIKEVVRSISRVPDPIKRGEYIKVCSQVLQVEESLLIAETNKVVATDIQKDRRDRERLERREEVTHEQGTSGTALPSPTTEKHPPQELDLVRILLTGADKMIQVGEEELTVASYILKELEEEVVQEFKSPLLRTIMLDCLDRLAKGDSLSSQVFLQHPNEDIRDLTIQFLSPDYQYSDNWEERYHIVLHTQRMPEDNFARDAQLALQRYQLHKLDHLCDMNAQRVKEAFEANDEEQYLHYLKFQQELQTLRNNVANQDLNTVVLK
ncbi:MAG: DNA primase [Saprospiraceae bacterium]|nr:DNA primase [Saprospiraceae bacterium]